MKGETKSKA